MSGDLAGQPIGLPGGNRDDDRDDEDSRRPFYQPRCVFCGSEHYVMNVPAVSNGAAGCHNCGRVPPVFYDRADYQAALREGRLRRAVRRAEEREPTE